MRRSAHVEGLEGDHLKRELPSISASASVPSAVVTAGPDNLRGLPEPPSSPLPGGRRVVKMVEMEALSGNSPIVYQPHGGPEAHKGTAPEGAIGKSGNRAWH